MSLDVLAGEIVRLSTLGRTTPVLVTPTYLSFRPMFFRHFVEAVSRQTDRPVRVDWLRTGQGIASVISDVMAKREAAKITRLLRRNTSTKHSVELSSSIGRPLQGQSDSGKKQKGKTAVGESHQTPIVIGLCHTGEILPTWATAIPLGESP
ncbi:hypothetical protein [Rubripirellula reticaptiva]|uniref:Uncharacterized protein n=1 Tax=Rubripirellula reticaptiva TaxID=2528013 RepID=A0A5C6EJ89_9BACT|nr:hypothetical protein [Rubripirellula reticaptiva]TWU47721.1 hypothetical protein Poly59_45620 [Rubripirellula reticaptiva]